MEEVASKMDAASTMGQEEKVDATDPTEYVFQIRDNAGNQLISVGRAANYDIKQNVREIRAILATNDEIFDRCMGSMMVDSEQDGVSTFIRYGFEVVKIRQLKKKIQLITHPDRMEEVFHTEPLSKIPYRLQIFVAKHKGSVFVDYHALFRQSLLLHEDVLGPYLAYLKEHLISVQVCLGEIDQWLMESNNMLNFLNSTFGSALEIPGGSEISWKDCSCENKRNAADYAADYTALPSVHQSSGSGKKIPEFLFRQNSGSAHGFSFQSSGFPDGFDHQRGSDSDLMVFGRQSSGSANAFLGSRLPPPRGFGSIGNLPRTPEKSNPIASPPDLVHCKKTVILKECVSFGNFQASFNISNKIDQKRLVKFLDFIST